MGWAWSIRETHGGVVWHAALHCGIASAVWLKLGETWGMVAMIYAIFAITLAHFDQEDTDKFDAAQELKKSPLQRKGWVRLGELSMRMRPDGRVELSDRAGYRIVEVESLEAWQARALTAMLG